MASMVTATAVAATGFAASAAAGPIAISVGAAILVSALAGVLGSIIIKNHNDNVKKEDERLERRSERRNLSEPEKRHIESQEREEQRHLEIERQRKVEIVLKKAKEAAKKRIANYLSADPNNFESFSQETINNLQKGAIRWKEEYGINVFEFINIAIVGQVKMGKSSLINALRGIDDEQYTSAKVGVIEVKTPLKHFACNLGATIFRLWDTPGCGTPSVPGEDFHFNDELILFDHILLVTVHGICENEKRIIDYCKKHNVPYSVICTKLDERLNNAKICEENKNPTPPLAFRIGTFVKEKFWSVFSSDSSQSSTSTRKTLMAIKKSLLDELKKGYSVVPRNNLFFVSAPTLRKFMVANGTIDSSTLNQSFFEEGKLLNHIGESMKKRFGLE